MTVPHRAISLHQPTLTAGAASRDVSLDDVSPTLCKLLGYSGQVVELGSARWKSALVALVRAGAQHRRTTFGDLIPVLRRAADIKLDDTHWHTSDVVGLRTRTLAAARAALDPYTWGRLADVRVGEISEWRDAHGAAIIDLLRVSLELAAHIVAPPADTHPAADDDNAAGPSTPVTFGPLVRTETLATIAAWAYSETGAETLGQALIEAGAHPDVPADVAAAAAEIAGIRLCELAPVVVSTRALLQQFLDLLPRMQRRLLVRRAGDPTVSDDVIAAECALPIEQLPTLERVAARSVARLLSSDEMRRLRWRVGSIAATIGSFAPAEHPATVTALQVAVGDDRDSELVGLVLLLAGSYRTTSGFVHRDDYPQTVAAIRALADHHGVYPAGVAAALAGLGVRDVFVDDVLTHVGARRLPGRRWVQWDSTQLGNRAVAVLAAAGPTSLDELVGIIGDGNRRRTRNVEAAVHGDRRVTVNHGRCTLTIAS